MKQPCRCCNTPCGLQMHPFRFWWWCDDGSAAQLLQAMQRGMRQASGVLPTSTSVSGAVRQVKEAPRWQDMHTAVSLLMCSASGTRASTAAKGFLWNVPSSAAMRTSLPAFAQRSAYSAISALRSDTIKRCTLRGCVAGQGVKRQSQLRCAQDCLT